MVTVPNQKTVGVVKELSDKEHLYGIFNIDAL